jgi:hypothetical protein
MLTQCQTREAVLPCFEIKARYNERRKVMRVSKVMSIVCASALLAVVGRAATQGNPGAREEAPRSQMLVGDQWTSPEVESVRIELERAVQEEIEGGCTERYIFPDGQVAFCGTSKERISKLEGQLSEAIRSYQLRNSEEIKDGLEAVKSLSLSGGLDVRFDGSSSSPFNKKAGSRVNFYVDSDGVEYWVNPGRNQVVNIDFSKSGLRLDPLPRLPRQDLRRIAESFLTEHVANFAEIKDSFSLRILDCRADDLVCTFRWEAAAWTNKSDMPPFVQVSVSVGGRVVGFTNTQSL